MKRRLVTLLTDKPDDAHLARRTVRYDDLVLVVHPGAEAVADAVARHEVALGGSEPRRVQLPDKHFERLVDGLRTLLGGSKNDNVLNAAGGDTMLVTAALVVAFELGCETWFCQEDRAVRLPVIQGLTLGDRIPEPERCLLHALTEGPMGAPALAGRFDLTSHKTGLLLRRLRKINLVATHTEDGVTWAELTAQGRQVVAHLRAMHASARNQTSKS